ncbi:tetratricopeptide repeat protein [Rivularia sp. UHCC 0363]|uniref:tetratricopeptide repeat protein n=1 Tax=Rivularia sp. UHCC 0363 TaxID=3110244 RepID=UPI002B20149C|nr:tetratricopeptide repeat protein [Rivularia sp. UHCC 0363]MEA5597597.1 tetratricopeptide repeat protein [Rivularia sp. UHCC 0363]
MQVLRLSNQKNIPIDLNISLGRGGEACIYTIQSDAEMVAKVYHKPTLEKARKLEAMVLHPPENPTASLGHISIAWPYELIRAADGSNQIIGFTMPRIRGMRPIIDFYNPRTRRQHCPLFNYQYLIRTARNLAAAFAALHASGYCVGDVNESNILVSDTALVTVVDTDSFQVRDPETDTVYRTPVGKPEFTPPELQNKTFSECDRAIPHDLFGLGVLIFQLLMEGTHPFSGIFQSVGEPPPYEGRIAKGHFTYSVNRRVPYSPTPIAPSWNILHPTLQQLFVRCFEDGHNNPNIRPNAQTWLLALAEAEEALVRCQKNPQHLHGKHQHKCPWCERSAKLGGRDPFPSIQAVETKQHLQPRPKPKRRRTAPTPRRRTAAIATAPRQTVTYRRNPQVFHNSYYQPRQKPRFYPVILCLLGFLTLGYLDIVTKFTSSTVDKNQYAQQTLIGSKAVENSGSTDYYKQGRTAYKGQKYEEAITNFAQAIQKNPDDSKAYVNRGNSHYNLKEYEAALSDYTHAVTLNPSEVKAFVNRGNVRYMLAEYSSDPDKEYKLAIDDYNQALRIDRDEVEAYIRRGIVRSQIAKFSGDSQKDYLRAIADFNQALQIESSRPEAFYQRGLVRYQLAQYSSNFEQEYKKALEDFNLALQLNSKLPKVYLKRGLVRYELAQYGGDESNMYRQQAMEDLQKAAKISLEQDDMDNYQQALSSICVVVDNKCDTLFQKTSVIAQ